MNSKRVSTYDESLQHRSKSPIYANYMDHWERGRITIPERVAWFVFSPIAKAVRALRERLT